MRRLLTLAGALLVGALPAAAQPTPTLYAGLNKSKGYVVGSALAQSGMHRYAGDTTWVHIGWNHPQVRGVGMRPDSLDVLFIAAGNGVMRSRDGGRSWRILTDWRVTEVLDVAVDPNAPDEVYAASSYGMIRSLDGGDTWADVSRFATVPDQRYTQTLALDRTRAGRLVAGTWEGLYLSEDRGETWQPVGPRGTEVTDVQQSAADPSLWMAATQFDGVLLSRDGGRTWQGVRGPLAKASVYAVTPDPTDARRMAAAGWNTGVYVSANGGRSWTRRTRGLPIDDFYQVLYDPNRPGRLWAATVEEGIYYSDDQGRSWQSAGMDGTLFFDLKFLPILPVRP